MSEELKDLPPEFAEWFEPAWEQAQKGEAMPLYLLLRDMALFASTHSFFPMSAVQLEMLAELIRSKAQKHEHGGSPKGRRSPKSAIGLVENLIIQEASLIRHVTDCGIKEAVRDAIKVHTPAGILSKEFKNKLDIDRIDRAVLKRSEAYREHWLVRFLGERADDSLKQLVQTLRRTPGAKT
jgi:hypothetical protein